MAEPARGVEHLVHQRAGAGAQAVVGEHVGHGRAAGGDREAVERNVPEQLAPALGDEILDRLRLDARALKRRDQRLRARLRRRAEIRRWKSSRDRDARSRRARCD